ncbi:MAG: hypothetical protein ACLFQP_12065, partial [Halothece sp.]
ILVNNSVGLEVQIPPRAVSLTVRLNSKTQEDRVMSKQQPNLVIFLPFIFVLPFVFAVIFALVVPVAIAKIIIKSRTQKAQDEVAVHYSGMARIFDAVNEEVEEEVIEPETGGAETEDETLVTTEEIRKVISELARLETSSKPIRSAGRKVCTALGLKPGNRAKLDSFADYLMESNISRSVWNNKVKEELNVYIN